MHEKLPLLIEVAIEPKTAADTDALHAALEALTTDNPRLGTATDKESGQTILRGTDELVLEDTIIRLDQLGIQINVGAPQVAYREVLAKPVTTRYVHKRLTGGTGQFALVEIDFIPQGPNSGFTFEDAVTDGSIPAEFIPAIKKGLSHQKDAGVLAGFPLTDFKATLVGGAYHETDSNELAFDIAARAAVREIIKYDAVQLAEPVMRVGIVTPEDFLGGVIGDLNSRRAWDIETISGQFYELVSALVPLANMFGYHGALDSMSQGHAKYLMDFDHYEPVPDPRGDGPTFPGAMGMRVA